MLPVLLVPVIYADSPSALQVCGLQMETSCLFDSYEALPSGAVSAGCKLTCLQHVPALQKLPHQGTLCGAHEGVPEHLSQCLHLPRPHMLPSRLYKPPGTFSRLNIRVLTCHARVP